MVHMKPNPCAAKKTPGLKSHGFVGVLGAILISAGCARHGRFIVPSSGVVVEKVPWTTEESAKDIAVVEVRRGNWSSQHVVRLKGAEKPHVHDRHDLVVTLLSGRVRMHIGDQDFLMDPGDVADVPHGTTHWAENISRGFSEAYVVFAPPFDGRDTRPVDR
jgi:mannose-6-phosphate isomerase-like protein (cupin superfamily)